MGGISKNNSKAGGDPPAFGVYGGTGRTDPPTLSLTIWPHRSLPRSGFRQILLFTSAMLALPLVPIIGTPVGWMLLPFLISTVLLLWYFINRNYRDGKLREELRLWPDLIVVERFEPNGEVLKWQANPFWVEIKVDADSTPENYLTLRGNDRVIELGAFLSPEERITLARDIEDAINKLQRTKN